MKGVVYSLSEPESKLVFYVGKTTMKLGNRLKQHIAEAKYFPAESKKCSVIRKIMEDGGEPSIEELEIVTFEKESELLAAEKKWILKLRTTSKLTNSVHNFKQKKEFTKQQQELISLLEDIDVPIVAIERKIGCPLTSLQKALKGERSLPKEWAIRLRTFVDKKEYVGLRRKKRLVDEKEQAVFEEKKDKTEKKVKVEEKAEPPKSLTKSEMLRWHREH